MAVAGARAVTVLTAGRLSWAAAWRACSAPVGRIRSGAAAALPPHHVSTPQHRLCSEGRSSHHLPTHVLGASGGTGGGRAWDVRRDGGTVGGHAMVRTALPLEHGGHGVSSWTHRRGLSRAATSCYAATPQEDATATTASSRQPQTSFVEALEVMNRGHDRGSNDGSRLASSPRPNRTLPTRTVTAKLPVPETQPPIAQRLVNTIMKHGKKATAQRLFNDMLAKVKESEMKRLAAEKRPEATAGDNADAALHNRPPRVDPMAIFLEAMDNLKPLVGLAGVRKGGAMYQVPVPLSDKARTITAVKWLVKTCRKKRSRGFSTVLANEVLAAYRREGAAYAKKLELHKTAEANRAYSNLRRR